MLIDILGYLAVNTMHGSMILISKTSICNVSMSTPFIEWWHIHFLFTFYLLDICIFCYLLTLWY